MQKMIIPMLCVTIFVILVVWFLLPRVARLMIHTPTAISIFVCLSMVQLMAVFISMRCTLCGHFLQVALTLILVVWYAIAASFFFSSRRRHTSYWRDWSSDVCSSDLIPPRVEYRISSHGETVRPLIQVVRAWGREHLEWKRRISGPAPGDGGKLTALVQRNRSEERRVGKECRSRWWVEQHNKEHRNDR